MTWHKERLAGHTYINSTSGDTAATSVGWGLKVTGRMTWVSIVVGLRHQVPSCSFVELHEYTVPVEIRIWLIRYLTISVPLQHYLHFINADTQAARVAKLPNTQTHNEGFLHINETTQQSHTRRLVDQTQHCFLRVWWSAQETLPQNLQTNIITTW